MVGTKFWLMMVVALLACDVTKASRRDEEESGVGTGLLYGCAAVLGGMVAVAAAPALLTTAGFTSAGIAAASIGSSMMSGAAIANGGGIAAGSLVATLQSAGTAGIGAYTSAVLGAGGAVAGLKVAEEIFD